MFGFGQMFQHEIPGSYSQTYKCFSISMLSTDGTEAEKGGKIFMPPSALDQLTRLNIQYPMLFKLINHGGTVTRATHCGVLQFTAEEGRIYIPYWMMKNLLLNEGDLVKVESVSLPVATFAKFQPQSVDFLDITNPKAVLENALRNFACLTIGDVIAITYNDKIYELCVLDTKPGNAVSIIETDMNVEFDAPVGYQEPQRQSRLRAHEVEEEPMKIDESDYIDSSKFRAFKGSGNRLDGKSKNTESAPVPMQPHEMKRGIPNYDFKRGRITFIRNSRSNGTTNNQLDSEPDFEVFSGEGQSLRKKAGRR